MNKPKYYQNYHFHTSFSHRFSKDSPVTHMHYLKEFDKLACEGIPQIYSTVEHGFQSPYFRIYDDLETRNKQRMSDVKKKPKELEYVEGYKSIKFIFGTEAYWVEDRFSNDSANNHIVLLAKNDHGRRKINRAIYESFKTGYYYKNRMDLDILLSLPKDDVFVTSACLAYWMKYATEDTLPFDENGNSNTELNWDRIDEITLKLFNHFTDFYLEVQANNTDKQKIINKHIMELHYKYEIPIISATDSHYINPSQHEDREDLLKSNKISYPEEEGWYLDLPDLDTLIERFVEQGVLTLDEIYEAIENTNKILDFEDIILDRSLKVPTPKKYAHLTQEERNEIFVNILRDEWKKQYADVNTDKLDEYQKEIKHDINEVLACNMADYFLCNYEIMKVGQEEYGGILTPSGRGSGVGFYLNKLLRFTKVDKVTSPVLMYSERFLTKERIIDSHQAPDIDHNVSEREPFIQAQRDIICEQGTYDLIAFGTLHYKSAFKMYARAYNLDPQLANEVTKEIEKYETALKYADDEDKDLIDIFDYVDKEKYGYLIEGCQEYKGIVDNLKSHPCSTVCSDLDVVEEIGVIMVKSETTKKENFVAVIESGTIDAFGWLKQDYLIVDSIGLTYEIYNEIGMEPMTVNQLLDTIDNDQKTWDVYKQGYTMCVNQCEQPKSTEKVRAYAPKNISELTQFIAGIRPSFKKMYKIFERREHFDYGIKVFDDLIQDAYCESSFILYQEHLMKVLGFAHFPMGDTYTIIKAISKKKEDKIKNAKEKFVPQFAKAIIETDETDDENRALELAEKVWGIVEDSANYSFNSAHAYCMAIDSVTLAWQKAHYPLEFYKVTLQRYTDKGNKDKVAKLKKEMISRGFELNPIRFGDDNRTFAIDRENNYISQTMASIKNMQKIVPDILYEISLKHREKPLSLFQIFKELKETKINKKSISILIKLNYFRDYGTIPYVESQYKIYQDISLIVNKLREAKTLKKAEIVDMGLPLEDVIECCETVTPKQMKDIDYNKLIKVFNQNYSTVYELIKSKYPYNEIEDIDIMSYQAELMGYVDLVNASYDDDIYIVEDVEVNKYGTPFLTLYRACDGEETNGMKVDKKWFAQYPVVAGNIVRGAFIHKDKKTKVVDETTGKEKWTPTGEKEKILDCYNLIETY